MYKIIIKFDDTEIKKYNFHRNESPILISDIDINEIVVSNKLPFGKEDFRYFIGYKYDRKFWHVCIFFLREIAYRTDFDETECMHFMIKEEKIFDKYMDVWEKVVSWEPNIMRN